MFQITQVDLPVVRNIVFCVEAGIGDLVHLQPTISKLLTLGYKIKVFSRPDAMGIYKDIEGVEHFPINATNLLNTALECGIRIDIGRQLHSDYSEHRSYKYARYTFDILGIPFDYELDTPHLSVSDLERRWGKKFNPYNKAIFIQVDSFRETKSLNYDNAILLIKSLQQNGWRIYYTAKKELMQHTKDIIWANRLSLRQLMCLISNMNLVVAPDSSLGLISIAMGIRTIMLWGSTEPQLYGYDVTNCESYMSKSPCRVCASNNCNKNTVECMADFTDKFLLDCIESPQINRDYPQRRKFIKEFTPDAYPITRGCKQLKIACVIPNLFLGGGETQLYYLLKNIKDEFGEMRIIQTLGDTVNAPSPIIMEYFQSVATLYPIPMNELDNKEAWLKKQLLAFNPDVILHHGITPIAEALQDIYPKPYVLQILHTSENNEWGIGSLRKAYKYTDTVICVSECIKQTYKSQLPCLEWVTILNGVPCKEGEPVYRNIDDQFNIGILSRLTSGKGIEHVINAMALLPKHINLLIGGSGWLEQKCKELASPYGSRVRFYGEVSDNYNFLSSLDCFALPSATEGNSMTVLESAMLKIPLVVTPVGAVPELFEDNVSAKIVEENPFSIASAILDLERDMDKCVTLASNAYNIVTAKATDKVMASLYASVIKRKVFNRTHPDTIAIIRIGGAGDVMMTLPMLDYLRNKYPSAKIWYYTLEKHACLIPNHLVDKIIYCKTIPTVVNYNVDYPLECKNYHPFHIVINCDHGMVWNTHEHVCDWYLNLVGAELGSRNMPIDYETIPYFPTKKSMALLQRHSANDNKDWGSDGDWLAIEEEFKDYKVLYLDGNYEGRSISYLESARLVSQARLLVGVDSVGLHMAHAVGVDAIGLYPATSPKIIGYEEQVAIVSNTKCWEHCYTTGGERLHERLQAKCVENKKCHKGITLDMVIKAIREWKVGK